MSMSLLTSNFWWLTPSCDLVGPSKDSTHTLWLCQNSYGKWPIYRWFTYKKWWCSIVKLVYQRVLHLKHHAKSDRLCDRLIYFPVLWWTLAGLIFWVPPSPFIPTISRKLTGTLRQSNVAMERCQHIYIYIQYIQFSHWNHAFGYGVFHCYLGAPLSIGEYHPADLINKSNMHHCLSKHVTWKYVFNIYIHD